MIITIDGPAGAGKSTVSRCLSERLGLPCLDTGAMYRAVAWLAIYAQVNPKDEGALARLVRASDLQLHLARSPMVVSVNGHVLTQALRHPDISRIVPIVAQQLAVREFLVERQRQCADQSGLIAEGRDMGTHVFPGADLKIFLTASIAERARRRYGDLAAQGQPVPTLEELEASIQARDLQDSTRSIAPLRKAPDAIELISDELSCDEVVAKILDLSVARTRKIVHVQK